ncbi:MAG: hypothetical protein O3C17_24865 [Planctomycetota bacterium]|nr:hypothetical protein [Planctomycetota bacterium]
MINTTLTLLTALLLAPLAAFATEKNAAIDIGSRRELFVDHHLIDRMEKTVLKLHAPTKAPRPKSPLIGAYVTVIKDGDRFRAVYRSYDPSYRGAQYDGNPGEMTCYAESRDGHEWTQPKLGLVEINGSRENNVILRAAPFSTNFSPFLDDRPGVPADQRFKATAGLSDHAVKHAQKTKPSEAAGIQGGLYTFASPDCQHWKQLSSEPAITMTEFGNKRGQVSLIYCSHAVGLRDASNPPCLSCE